MRSARILILAIATACAAAPAFAADDPGAPPFKRRAGLMVDPLGRGIYTYDRDTTPNVSVCDAFCLRLWPAMLAGPDAKPRGRFSIGTLPDGRRIWAWDGKPLYRWISDRRRGDARGDRVAGVWTLVRLPCGNGDTEVPPLTMAERPCPAPRTTASSSPAPRLP